MADIRAISYQKNSVGKRIKGSKVKYEWTLSIDQELVYVVLTTSKISKKREVKANNVQFFSGKHPKKEACLVTFQFCEQTFAIVKEEDYVLRVGSRLFGSLPPPEPEVRETPSLRQSGLVEPVPMADWELLAKPYREPKPAVPTLHSVEYPNIHSAPLS